MYNQRKRKAAAIVTSPYFDSNASTQPYFSDDESTHVVDFGFFQRKTRRTSTRLSPSQMLKEDTRSSLDIRMDIKSFTESMKRKVKEVTRQLREQREVHIQTTLTDIHANIMSVITNIKMWDMCEEYKCTCCDKFILSVSIRL